MMSSKGTKDRLRYYQMEKFIVKHYNETERPIIKGNGFDGLEIGEDREEAEEFINFVNSLIDIINETKNQRASFYHIYY